MADVATAPVDPSAPTPAERETSGARASADAPPSFPVQRIAFGGRTGVPVLMQNANGPCPLLALCNILFLRGALELGAGATEVAQV